MKTRTLVATGIFLLLAGAAGITFWKPLQIAYHRRALERLHEEIYAEPSVTSGGLVGYGDGDQFERQDYHCQRLAELGYFFHKRYEMENLPDTGEVHRAFWRLVQKEFPDRRYPTLSYPDNVLEVWDLAEYEPKWDAFVEKHNVPGFAERFMEQTNDAEQTHAPEPAAGRLSSGESSPPAR
jgi:hypothetical protein